MYIHVRTETGRAPDHCITADLLDQWFGPQSFTQMSWVRLPVLPHSPKKIPLGPLTWLLPRRG